MGSKAVSQILSPGNLEGNWGCRKPWDDVCSLCEFGSCGAATCVKKQKWPVYWEKGGSLNREYNTRGRRPQKEQEKTRGLHSSSPSSPLGTILPILLCSGRFPSDLIKTSKVLLILLVKLRGGGYCCFFWHGGESFIWKFPKRKLSLFWKIPWWTAWIKRWDLRTRQVFRLQRRALNSSTDLGFFFLL